MKMWYNIVVLFSLIGCTTINPNGKVPDWPELKETVHVVSHAEMKAACNKYTSGLFPTALACSEWDFDKMTCDTWIEEGSPQWMYEHEHMHCIGYDHYGSTYMQENWNEWKEQNK